LVASDAHAADDPQRSATQALTRAKELHKAGKFREALNELMRAYALAPQQDLLYGIAQLHVKLNNCPEAVRSSDAISLPDASLAEGAAGHPRVPNQPAVVSRSPKESVVAAD
jgi:thioredoxin-like negative regulator of GroEL